MFSPATLIGILCGGGLGLSACNQIHVESGVLSYPNPDVLGQAWWAPPVFGVAAVAICVGATPFARRLEEPGRVALITATLWFVGAYAATGVLDGSPELLAGGLVVAWIGRLVASSSARAVLASCSILLAAAGAAVEIAMTGAGMFEYAREDLGGVPIWLPGLYLHGGPLALALVGRLYWTASPRGSTTSQSPPNSTTSWQRTWPGGSST